MIFLIFFGMFELVLRMALKDLKWENICKEHHMFAESDKRQKKNVCENWVYFMQIINSGRTHLEFKLINIRTII